MSDIRQARKAVVERILEGAGKTSHALRRAAFGNAGLAEPLSTLVQKVAKYASQVTDDDIALSSRSPTDHAEGPRIASWVTFFIGSP